MSIDLVAIAQRITDNTPEEAAVVTAQLIQATLNAFSSSSGSQRFVAALRVEMARLGFRLDPDPRLGIFARLPVGAYFKTLNGKRYRKIEPVAHHDRREDFTIYLEAYDLDAGQPVYMTGGEVVQRGEPEDHAPPVRT